MTAIEHKQLKGITVKNFILTIVSTISISSTVMTTYFCLKSDISDVRSQNEVTTRVNEVRLKTLEAEVAILQQDVKLLESQKK